MAEASAPETLLDTVAAAKRLGVSPSFLAKARMQGNGPRYRKLGRAVRYSQVDLDHWLLACSRTSTAEQATGIGWPARKVSGKA
jgi:predicted DNA-binding transcriptional regulator AlpA